MTSPLTFGVHLVRNQETYSALEQQAKTENKRLVLVKYKNQYAVRVLPRQGAIARVLSGVFGATARQEKKLRDFAANLPHLSGTQQQVAQALSGLVQGEKGKRTLAERASLIQKEFFLDADSLPVITAALQFNDESIAEGNSVAALLTDAELFSIYQYNTTSQKPSILQGAKESNPQLISASTQKYLNHIRHAIDQVEALGLGDALIDAKQQIGQARPYYPYLAELKGVLKAQGLTAEELASESKAPEKPPRQRQLAEPERVKAKEAQDKIEEAGKLSDEGKLSEALTKAREALTLARDCDFYHYGTNGAATKVIHSILSRTYQSLAQAARSAADTFAKAGNLAEAEKKSREALSHIRNASPYSERANKALLSTYLMDLASILEQSDPNSIEANALRKEAKELLGIKTDTNPTTS